MRWDGRWWRQRCFPAESPGTRGAGSVVSGEFRNTSVSAARYINMHSSQLNHEVYMSTDRQTPFAHDPSCVPGAAFSKVPRKILGKLLILLVTTTITTSLLLLLLLLLLLHSFLLLRWTELIGLLVQCSTVALYPLHDFATCVSVAPKIRRFPKICLGTFENAALVGTNYRPSVYRPTLTLKPSNAN